MKTCTRCGLTLPKSSFYVDNRKKDGLNPACKTCMCNGQCSGCGKPVIVTRASLDNPVCHACRRARKTGPDGRYYKAGQRPCEICGALFWSTNAVVRTCSTRCKVALTLIVKGHETDPEGRRARELERWRKKNHKRRLAAQASQEPYTRDEIAARDHYTCQLCTFPVDMSLSGLEKWGPTIDHILPISLGGSDTPDNVQLAHRDCNVSKGARV